MMGAGHASSTLYKSNPNVETGGGNKKQGITSRVGLNNWENREIQTQSNGIGRFKLVYMNQLGGIGPGHSMFGGRWNRADGVHKNEILTNPLPGPIKAVFLLNLTTTTNVAPQETLKYYWLNYPEEFKEYPIVDNAGSLEKTLQLLDEYYGYGFRYFISFQTSTILKGVLESKWFDFHPDAIGISPTANSNSLNVPKNIYRLLPDNSFIINSISEQINAAIDGGFNIYYIYSENELVCEDALRILNQTIGNYSNCKTLETTPYDFDTPTKIKNFLNGSSSSDILITLLFYRKKYLNLYDTSLHDNALTFPGQQYDILASGTPVIPIGSRPELSDKYNVSLIKGINTSILWRNGYNSLGSSNYSTVTLNILTLLNQFANNQSIDTINSHYGILQFDPVTKDLLYPSILIETFDGDIFTSKSLYLVDPILGPYNATFTNPAPTISTIPTPSYKPFGKAIALFELTNYLNNIDTIFNDSLDYYWNKNPSFPKFPVIDTEHNSVKTLELLNLYYSRGYRIFLGFSRSSVLSYVVDWFNNHLDAVGISLLSTAISLNEVPRNIYRINPSDDAIVNAVIPYLPKTAVGNVYYIYTGNEPATQDVLEELEKLENGLNVIPYPVIENTIDLTVAKLQILFANASSDDVVVLYLFDNQPYYDLYNDTLTFPGEQYDIINTQLPSINGTAQTELDNNLFYVQNTYPNTSLLWRENSDYLTEKAGNLTTSTGLANALSMIDYFQKGKNVGLLGSYSAVLQFNEYKDIQYPTFLFRKYQKAGDAFVESSISFNDPLLGNFQGEF